MVEINWHPTERQLRQFGCWFLPGFLLLAGLIVWHRSGSLWPWPALLWLVGLAGALVGWYRPSLLRPVFVGLTCAAFPVGWLVSHVILAVAFYCVFTPVGLLMRLLGYDPLRRRFDPAADSYWVPRDNERDVRSYFRQF